MSRLKTLQVSAKSVVQFLSNPNLVKQLRSDKAFNLQFLQGEFNIGTEQIEALYHFAKFQFDCGNYSGASEFLYHYRTLCTNPQRNISALWGKLAAEILLQNWEQATEDLNRLKEIIDAANFETPVVQLVQRTWLMHWALFIYFNHENGRNALVDLFFQEPYLNALQHDAQHLLRYLSVAVVVNKRRRSVLKDLIKVSHGKDKLLNNTGNSFFPANCHIVLTPSPLSAPPYLIFFFFHILSPFYSPFLSLSIWLIGSSSHHSVLLNRSYFFSREFWVVAPFTCAVIYGSVGTDRFG